MNILTINIKITKSLKCLCYQNKRKHCSCLNQTEDIIYAAQKVQLCGARKFSSGSVRKTCHLQKKKKRNNSNLFLTTCTKLKSK